MTARLLVAIASGRVDVEGSSQYIKAGITRWDSRCPELADPEVARLFGVSPRPRAPSPPSARSSTNEPATTTERPKRRTDGAPSWMLGPPPREHVEFRPNSTPRVTVSLRASVWDDLRRHARESSDGYETAGFLFGEHVRSWHHRVSVGWVTDMVKKRAKDSCAFDIESLVQEKGLSSEEVYANTFAACLLMPEQEVRRLHSKGHSPTQLAVYFGVSSDAMHFRLKNLQLADNLVFEPVGHEPA